MTEQDAARLAEIRANHNGESAGCTDECPMVFLLRLLDAAEAALLCPDGRTWKEMATAEAAKRGTAEAALRPFAECDATKLGGTMQHILDARAALQGKPT